MTKKFNLKYLLLDDDFEEDETINWIEENDTKNYYNCGCCSDCLCDDNIECKNCKCNCNLDSIEDEFDIIESDEDIGTQDINNFDIGIIQDKHNEKKVRITLKFNVILSNKKNEIICIDVDINRNTYLKIAEELFT